MEEMFVLQFIFEKCSHTVLKFCQFVCEALLLNVTKNCDMKKNFRPEYGPASSRELSCRELTEKSHFANCRVASCLNPCTTLERV
jgi:hypothetical protein